MEPIAIIRERTDTVADEWQARDITLSRSEEATVRLAAEALDIPISHHPTGRTAQIVLKECMDRALLRASRALSNDERRDWHRVYFNAKVALGRMNN